MSNYPVLSYVRYQQLDRMGIEAKKLDIIMWIAGIQDESIIDSMLAVTTRSPDSLAAIDLVNQFTTTIEPTVNLEKIKQGQGWTPPDKQRVDELIKQADIQEPIEQLLEDLTA